MPKSSRKALLIDIAPSRSTLWEPENRLDEADKLMRTLGGISVVKKIQKQVDIEYKTYIDSRLIDEVLEVKEKCDIDLLILNNLLKPQQIFALTEIFRPSRIEVWDRIDLILHIFSLHAESAEAKLQIELARIRHMGPRIFGMGMELSRQGGGIGTSGIGETNTEIMKRHLKEQERRVFQKLEKVAKSKDFQRERRERQNFKTVAMVGYTNAGKSSLMRALTHKENIRVEDAFFVTLDTRIGRLYLPGKERSVLLSDTIGFIADLPHDLISAFSSTLSETIHANALLHVVDISDPEFERKIEIVDTILKHLHISEKKQILVFNKIDLMPKRFGKTKILKKYKDRTPLFISSTEKENLDRLKKQIEKVLFPKLYSIRTNSSKR